MFSFFTILRIIYSSIFTLIAIYFTQFITAIENKKKCSLSEGWRITNGKVLSSLLMIVGIVNIVVPANKFLSTLPIVGSSYILLFALALFGDLFIIYSQRYFLLKVEIIKEYSGFNIKILINTHLFKII